MIKQLTYSVYGDIIRYQIIKLNGSFRITKVSRLVGHSNLNQIICI